MLLQGMRTLGMLIVCIEEQVRLVHTDALTGTAYARRASAIWLTVHVGKAAFSTAKIPATWGAA